jgi:hypothetical protein
MGFGSSNPIFNGDAPGASKNKHFSQNLKKHNQIRHAD